MNGAGRNGGRRGGRGVVWRGGEAPGWDAAGSKIFLTFLELTGAPFGSGAPIQWGRGSLIISRPRPAYNIVLYKFETGRPSPGIISDLSTYDEPTFGVTENSFRRLRKYSVSGRLFPRIPLPRNNQWLVEIISDLSCYDELVLLKRFSSSPLQEAWFARAAVSGLCQKVSCSVM